ncbi:MAG: MFS transporter [Patescibacteria group bacterium]|jgi:MFS family permease
MQILQNKIVGTLLAAESVWSFGAGLFFPIFAIYSTNLGGDITDAGIAAAIFIFVTSALEYPIGKLLDRYHEKFFIVGDYFLEAAVFIGYIFVENTFQLFFLQVILGFANAIGDPAWESLYDRSTPKKKSGSYWANSHFFVGMFNATGILLGSFLVSAYGFSSVFLLGAIFSGCAGFLALAYLRK